MNFQLPVKRLALDHVPAQFRTWVEQALTGPLNRVLVTVEAALGRLLLAQLNVQFLDYKGLAPTTLAPAEFASTLAGPCRGVIPLWASTLDAGGTPASALGSLSLPAWVEVAAKDRSAPKIRITQQSGLSSSRYAVRWMAIGS